MPETPLPIRKPAVAGRFYPGSPSQLEREVEGYLRANTTIEEPLRAAAVMAPHAGYVYSGGVAGQVFARVAVPERVIILCPNHTGMGARIAVMDQGAFRIPGADIPIDRQLAQAILQEVPGAQADNSAHAMEHAIEVELPFLHHRQPALRIVPIVLAHMSEHDAIELGKALERAVTRIGARPVEDVLLVASSDMSHYLPDERTRELDHMALTPLLDFDPSGLYRTVSAHDISMCGFIPATAMLSYGRAVAAGKPRLVAYATSGDAFGDRSRVVGYAGVIVPGGPCEPGGPATPAAPAA
jgi:AmmeMemoRadiSam system protein B